LTKKDLHLQKQVMAYTKILLNATESALNNYEKNVNDQEG